MKNRIVALALTLAMVLSIAVASAAVIPGNVKDVADLPAVPSVPSMKVKANDHVATVTLSEEVQFLNAWWSWAPTAVEMDGTVGTYRVDGHKNQVGTGTFGSLSKPTEIKDIVTNYRGVSYPRYKISAPQDSTKDEYDRFLKGDREFKSHFTWADTWANGGGNGKEWTHVWKAGKDAQGNDIYKKYTYSGTFGWYEMGFAYDLKTADGVDVKYDRFGRPVEIGLWVDNTNFFNAENPASGAYIVWKVRLYGGSKPTEQFPAKRVWCIDSIKEQYDEGDVASITAVYHNGNGKLLDYAVESR
jgi:hypothetical protein